MRQFVIFTLTAFAVCISIQVSAQTDSTIVPESDSSILVADTAHVNDTTVISLPKSSLESKVAYTAEDSIRFDLRERKVYLYNKAVVDYENMKLEADFIVVDFAKSELHATGAKDSTGKMVGEPIFTLDGDKYNAREMNYNFKTKLGTSKGVMLVEAEGFIRAEKFFKDTNDDAYLRGVSYTTCTNPKPHFHISSEKFKVIPGKQVVSGPANLVVAGVNTPLFIPFGFFPISKTRSKGVVIGTYGQSERRGYFLNGFGYYLPIGDNLDLQLTADISFRGSYGFHARTAYKKRYKYNGNFTFDYNYNEFGEQESPDFYVSHDYRLIWNYNQDPKAKPGSRFNAKVNFVTKNQQRNNSTNINDIVATNANSNVTYSRSFLQNKLNLTVNGRMDQNLSTGDINMDLPEVNLNLNRIMPFSNMSGPRKNLQILRNIGFSYGMNFKNNLKFNQDSVVLTGSNEKRTLNMEALNNFSNGMRHSIPISTSFKVFQYFNISPSVSYTDYWYFKTIRQEWSESGDSIRTYDEQGFRRAGSYRVNASLTTVVYGMHTSKKPGRKIKAIRHVMTPSVTASYNPDFSKVGQYGNRTVQIDSEGHTKTYSIFSQGIYGGPSGKESGSLNLNIGNNLEMKVLSKKDTSNGGIKKVKIIESLQVGTGYDFLADSLQVKPVNISGNTTLFKVLRMSFGASADPYTFAFNDSLNRNVRINTFELASNKRLGRLTMARFSFSTNLNPQARKKLTSNKGTEQELNIINSYRQYFVDFNIPWSLNVTYTYNYGRTFDEKARKDQSVQFSGDLKLTENWKIAVSSGYNLTQKQLLITKIDFFRNLHCWEFNFGWIPAGTYKRFDFTIRAKASVLQDLKLSRRGFWYDQN